MTEAQLLAALWAARRILPEGDEGMTAMEIQRALKIGEKSTRNFLRGLAAEGRMTVSRKEITDLAGRKQVVPAYIIKE